MLQQYIKVIVVTNMIYNNNAICVCVYQLFEHISVQSDNRLYKLVYSNRLYCIDYDNYSTHVSNMILGNACHIKKVCTMYRKYIYIILYSILHYDATQNRMLLSENIHCLINVVYYYACIFHMMLATNILSDYCLYCIQ